MKVVLQRSNSICPVTDMKLFSSFYVKLLRLYKCFFIEIRKIHHLIHTFLIIFVIIVRFFKGFGSHYCFSVNAHARVESCLQIFGDFHSPYSLKCSCPFFFRESNFCASNLRVLSGFSVSLIFAHPFLDNEFHFCWYFATQFRLPLMIVQQSCARIASSNFHAGRMSENLRGAKI